MFIGITGAIISTIGAERLKPLRLIDLDLFYVAPEVFLVTMTAGPDQGVALNRPAMPPDRDNISGGLPESQVAMQATLPRRPRDGGVENSVCLREAIYCRLQPGRPTSGVGRIELLPWPH